MSKESLPSQGSRGKPQTDGAQTQAELSKRAAKIAKDDESGAPVVNPPTPDPGIQPIENPRTAPSGALDHAGEKPSRERSRGR